MQQADQVDINNSTETASGMSPDNSAVLIGRIVAAREALRQQDDHLGELHALGSMLRVALLATDTMSQWYGLDDATRRAIVDLGKIIDDAEERLEDVLRRIGVVHQVAYSNVHLLRIAA